MINPKDLDIITKQDRNKQKFTNELNAAQRAINIIELELISATNNGDNETEFNLITLYNYVIYDPGQPAMIKFSFCRHNFNMFCAHIRNKLNKLHYKFEEKQYQYDAYPDPILIIRW